MARSLPVPAGRLITRTAVPIRTTTARKSTSTLLPGLISLLPTPTKNSTLASELVTNMPPRAVRHLLERVGVQTLYIEGGSPWENGYIESFNGGLRDGLLNAELFQTVLEAQVLFDRCYSVSPRR